MAERIGSVVGSFRRLRSRNRGAVVESTAVNVLMLILSLFSGLLAARLLGPVVRGELAAVMTWGVLGSTFAVMGLPDAIVYYSAKYPHTARRQLVTAFIAVVASSCVLTALLWIALPTLLAAQSRATVALARFCILGLVVEAAWLLPYCVLRGTGQFRLWNLLRLLPPVLWVSVLVGNALVGHMTAKRVAVSYLVMRFLCLFGVVWRIWKAVPGPVGRALLRPMLRYGLPNLLNSVPNVVNSRFDQLVIAGLLPSRFLGVYVVAVSWSSVTNLAATAMSFVVFPRLAELGQSDGRTFMLRRASRLGFLLSLMPTLIALPLTPVLLPIVFGEAFRPAVLPALILLFASIFSGWNLILHEAARGLGKPSYPLRAEASAIVVTLMGLFLLVRPLGLVGASLVSLGAYALSSVISLILLSRHEHISIRRFLPSPSDVKEILGMWSILGRVRVGRPDSNIGSE